MGWVRRAWNWCRGVFELAGAIQVLGSLGGAGILAVVIPAILRILLDLPPIVVVLLAICVFLVALALLLAALKFVLELRSNENTRHPVSDVGVTPPLGSPSEVSEPLREQLGSVRAERDALKNQIESQAGDDSSFREDVEELRRKVEYWENRRLLSVALNDSWREGRIFYGGRGDEWGNWNKIADDEARKVIGDNQIYSILALSHTVSNIHAKVWIHPSFDGREWTRAK